jgi:anthranilate synthase component 1
VTGHVCKWLDHRPDLSALTAAFPDHFPYLLESSATGPLGSHSLLLFASGPKLVLQPGSGLSGPGAGETFFDRLESWYQEERHELGSDEDPAGDGLPFVGGWFIYLGYEAVAEIEDSIRLPANETGLPDALAHRCEAAVIVIHEGQDRSVDRAVAVAESPELLTELIARIGKLPYPGEQESIGTPGSLGRIEAEDPGKFKDSVARIHEYLVAGDVFQVNISRPWKGSFSEAAEPAALYQSLCKHNPAPFAGQMRWQDMVMMSSSPERLVQIRGDQIQTRPIAGTRPRGSDSGLDRALSAELLGNLKERAEHVMLIDLERNDLGRVCQPGTVEVDEFMVVESYAHVHHIVSNVRGELRQGVSPVDAIKAVFPGGTITGCPKVRCMQIIAELEKEGRGFYTGSMGYLGRDGQMDLNILIRSLLLHGEDFSFRTGAGIVTDSVAENEVTETQDKARGLLFAIDPDSAGD